MKIITVALLIIGAFVVTNAAPVTTSDPSIHTGTSDTSEFSTTNAGSLTSSSEQRTDPSALSTDPSTITTSDSGLRVSGSETSVTDTTSTYGETDRSLSTDYTTHSYLTGTPEPTLSGSSTGTPVDTSTSVASATDTSPIGPTETADDTSRPSDPQIHTGTSDMSEFSTTNAEYLTSSSEKRTDPSALSTDPSMSTTSDSGLHSSGSETSATETTSTYGETDRSLSTDYTTQSDLTGTPEHTLSGSSTGTPVDTSSSAASATDTSPTGPMETTDVSARQTAAGTSSLTATTAESSASLTPSSSQITEISTTVADASFTVSSEISSVGTERPVSGAVRSAMEYSESTVIGSSEPTSSVKETGNTTVDATEITTTEAHMPEATGSTKSLSTPAYHLANGSETDDLRTFSTVDTRSSTAAISELNESIAQKTGTSTTGSSVVTDSQYDVSVTPASAAFASVVSSSDGVRSSAHSAQSDAPFPTSTEFTTTDATATDIHATEQSVTSEVKQSEPEDMGPPAAPPEPQFTDESTPTEGALSSAVVTGSEGSKAPATDGTVSALNTTRTPTAAVATSDVLVNGTESKTSSPPTETSFTTVTSTKEQLRQCRPVTSLFFSLFCDQQITTSPADGYLKPTGGSDRRRKGHKDDEDGKGKKGDDEESDEEDDSDSSDDENDNGDDDNGDDDEDDEDDDEDKKNNHKRRRD